MQLKRRFLKTKVFKCRQKIKSKNKQCDALFTLKHEVKFTYQDNSNHQLMESEMIESEIKLLLNEINNLIVKNPNHSIKSLYDDKEIELVNKYGSELVAKYWPEF